MSDNKDKVKGCVHPEDSWTDYGCGDCGDYADNNGCRGPRGKVDIKTMSNYKVPTVQLREAYNRTLKEANFCGSASFHCGPEYNGASYVLCQECPLNKTNCDDKHDVKYWGRWWKELTGEKDNNEANDSDLLKKSDIDNTVKVTTNWVYQVILDYERCLANNIDLRNSYIKTRFYGISLTGLGEGSRTAFELYEEKDGSNIYSKDNPPPVVRIPNETIRTLIPVKQIICKNI